MNVKGASLFIGRAPPAVRNTQRKDCAGKTFHMQGSSGEFSYKTITSELILKIKYYSSEHIKLISQGINKTIRET